jgi:hypothetical protein
VGAFFQPLVLEAHSGGISKATAKIVKKHAMLAVIDWLQPDVSAQEVAADTEHQGTGAQRGPDHNVHAVRRRVKLRPCYAECRRLGSARCGGCRWEANQGHSSKRVGGHRH